MKGVVPIWMDDLLDKNRLLRLEIVRSKMMDQEEEAK